MRIFSDSRSYQEGTSHLNINEPYSTGTFLNTVTFQLGATVDFCLSFPWQVITSEEEIRLPLGELSCNWAPDCHMPIVYLTAFRFKPGSCAWGVEVFAIGFSKMPDQTLFIISTRAAEGPLSDAF